MIPSFLARAGALAVLALSTASACGGPAARTAGSPRVDAIAAVEELSSEGARIALRRSVVADEYFWLRAKLMDGDAPPAFAEAVDAMHELHAAFAGDASAWEDLEVPLGSVSSATELVAEYAKLPETIGAGTQAIKLRALALRLGRALVATEKSYQDGPYRAHHTDIQQAAALLAKSLAPADARVVRAVEEELALGVPERPIVLTLVGDAPYPGSFAGDARGRSIASFVRVRGLSGSALVEVVLQQYLHTIDELTVRGETLPNDLRRAFVEREVDASDPNVEMAVNTVLFAEAASLVRRFVAPTHVALGEGGFYAFYPPALGIVEIWKRRIAGEPAKAVVEGIVDLALEPPPG